MELQNKFIKGDLQQLLVDFGTQITTDKIKNAMKFLNDKQYYITDILGVGGFGLVLKGINSESNKVIAIKLLIAQNVIQRELCIEEAMRIKLIKSDYVIQIYEWFEDDKNECIYIITECCEMGDLCKYMKKNNFTLNPKTVSLLAQKILLGIEDIHKHNVIHSDIKPSNILLTEDLNIKICDLGLSKKLSMSQSHVSTAAGTFSYQALEQIQNKLVKQSDYYAIGCVLCFMCQIPIEQDFTLAFKMKNGEFPPIPNNQYKLLVQIAFQMMNTNPLQRTIPLVAIQNLKELEGKLIEQNQYQSIQNEIQDIKYIGDFQKGQKSGKGREYYENGKIMFEGTWENNSKQGKGIFYFSDGNKQVANYQSGKKEGYVNEYYLNENQKSYCFYKNDQQNGYYEDWYENGERKSKGQKINNMKTGEWLELYVDGEIKYKGGYKNNQKEGIGEFKNQLNDIQYSGEWKNGLFDGLGTYQIHINKLFLLEYKGQFQLGLKHGKGHELYYYKPSKGSNNSQIQIANKKKMIEEIQLLQRNGCYQNEQRIEFEGEFIFGQKLNGKQIYQQFEYIGDLQNDEMNGRGIILNRDSKNKIYDGEFFQGMHNGNGILYHPNGSYLKGIFFMGSFVQGFKLSSEGDVIESIENVKKQKVESEDTIYYGYLNQNNEFEGEGMLLSKSTYKIIYVGSFKENQYCGEGILYKGEVQQVEYSGTFQNGEFIKGQINDYREGTTEKFDIQSCNCSIW